MWSYSELTVWLGTLTVSLLPLPESMEAPVFVLCMVMIGVPHGGLDHLVFLQGSSSESLKYGDSAVEHFMENGIWKDWNFWMGFLRIYVSVIVVYAILWWTMPWMSFVVFMLLSAYHFGQIQLDYLNVVLEESWLKTVVYLFWGIAILTRILFTHYRETERILESFFELKQVVDPEYAVFVMYFSEISTLMLLSYLRFKRMMSTSSLCSEVIAYLLISILNSRKSLLICFSIFYGLWHSLKSMEIHSEELGMTIYQCMLHAIPFSILSFIGLIVILVLIQMQSSHSPYLIFLCCLGTLAAPHILVGHTLYSRRRKQNLSCISKLQDC